MRILLAVTRCLKPDP